MTSKYSHEQGEMHSNAYKLFAKLLKGIILHTLVLNKSRMLFLSRNYGRGQKKLT